MTQLNSAHTNGANGTCTIKKDLSFDSIENSIAAFARGEFVIVLDDTSRENEGDLMIAAENCTTEKMSFMIRYTSGFICAPISAAQADALDLPIMVNESRDPHEAAYTITVDAQIPGVVTSGISAHDRALTLQTFSNPQVTSACFKRPGHTLPLRAADGLVRARRGHTEAALELCRIAGKRPAAAICEMIIDGEPVPGETELKGGRMMSRDDCLVFGKKWGIMVCTIEDLVEYVEEKEGQLQI